MLTIFLAVCAVGALYVVLPTVLSALLSFRGKRVIQCPETRAPAGVEVDAAHAAFAAMLGGPELRLKDCTRWPERSDCGQECIAQIEAAPEECLVRTKLTRWFEGKKCDLCGKTLGRINWAEHKPALMDAERRTMEWNEIPVERLYETLSSCHPVCWNCHTAESFRRLHPDLVVDRPRNSVGGSDRHVH